MQHCSLMGKLKGLAHSLIAPGLSAFLILSLLAGCTPAAAPAPKATLAPSGTPSPVATLAPSLTPTITALPSLTATPTPVSGTLLVDVGQDLGPINPLVYGSNYGPWLFVTSDVKPQAIAARLTYLRYPGGNWGDLNDLDDWMIDQYIALCKELGTQPAISVRLRGGTPEKAAELVRKVNKEKGYNVRYWSIGNEPNLFPDYDIKTYNQEWRRYAEAMRAVDPSILLIGPETSQFMADLSANPKDKSGLDWMEEFLKANGDMVDIVAFHRYPFPHGQNGEPPSKAELMDSTQEWDVIIPALRALIRKDAGRDLPVAVTEVNSSWASNSGGDTTMDSHANAIWWGDVLGRMIRQGVDIVAQFCLVGEYGLMNKYQVFPIYYVYQMYQKFGVERVSAASPDPQVSLFAAKRADGALTLMFINRAPEEKKLPLKLENFTGQGDVETWLFDASHNAEKVDSGKVSTGTTIALPAESMLLYILQPAK